MAQRAITLKDIVELREISEVAASPNGKLVAVLVRQGFVACDCYQSAIYIAAPGRPRHLRKLVEDDALQNMRWSPDGRFVTFLSDRSGARQLWRVGARGGRPQLLVEHAPGAGSNLYEALGGQGRPEPVGVERFEWSPDGSSIAYTVRPRVEARTLARLDAEGVLYDDARMYSMDIIRKEWAVAPIELWVRSIPTGMAKRIWAAPIDGANTRSLGIAGFTWSPDSRRIALSFASGISPKTGWVDYDLGVLDVVTGRFAPIVESDSTVELAPSWSPDGAELAYLASVGSNQPPRGASLVTVDVQTNALRRVPGTLGVAAVTKIWWLPGQNKLMYETSEPGGSHRGRGGLYDVSRLDGTARRLSPPHDHFSKCSYLIEMSTVCVRQNSGMPPEAATLSLKDGRVEQVADVNPEMRAIHLTGVTELRWVDVLGAESTGYLLTPHGDNCRTPRPLVVIMYGFQGRFVAAAEWLTSYPAQALARAGFVVLLWNAPSRRDWNPNDKLSGYITWRARPLLSLKAAIARLADEGIADTTRVGIMGWSYGGYLAQLALTELPTFRAASIGLGGAYSPGAYWFFGNQAHRLLYESIYGGPPYGRDLAGWIAMSPAANLDRVTAPVLIEAQADEALLPLEMYTALRRNRIPVEYVIYPDDAHVLARPVHRMNSMRRNLEWLSFWLFGREYLADDRSEQYDRWRRMRYELPPGRSPFPGAVHSEAADVERC